MANNQDQQTGNLQGLLAQLQPQQRGMLSAPPTEQEQKQQEVLSTQANLTRTLQIIVEALPYVHPDWLLSSVSELSDEMADIARLQFVQNAVSSIDQVIRLQDFLLAYSKKLLQDTGAEVPEEKQDRFNLDVVLKELSERISGNRR